MLKNVLEAERAERNQEADCALIGAAVRLAEKEIAFLEGRQLGPDELRKKWCAIRDRTIFVVRDVRRNIVRRANEAKETEKWIIERWLREKSDDRVLSEFSSTLDQVPTKGLLDYLPSLIELGDLARIQCVCMVFAARRDCQEYKVIFDRMLRQFVLTQCGDLGETTCQNSSFGGRSRRKNRRSFLRSRYFRPIARVGCTSVRPSLDAIGVPYASGEGRGDG
jgi:hypothetical protein